MSKTFSWKKQNAERMERWRERNKYKHWISFQWTAPQFRQGVKTVTRRFWPTTYAKRFLTAMEKRELVGACDRALFRGGEPIGAVRIVSMQLEAVDRIVIEPEYGRAEVAKEGFLDMAPEEFIRRFLSRAKARGDGMLWRVEFEKVN